MARLSARDDPAFTQSSWLGALDPDLAEALRHRSFRLTAAQGHLLSAFKDHSNTLFGVSQGALALRTEDGRGNAVIGHVMGPGSWIGAAGVLIDSARELDLVVQTDSVFYSIPAIALQDLSKRDGRVWQAVGQLSARNTMLALNIARGLMIRDPRARCLGALKRLVAEFGLNTDIPITQDDLADLSVLSRGAVSAILRDLERDGQVQRRYGRLRVLNL